MVAVGLAGVMLGDGAMFQIGKRFGYRVFEWKWMAKIMHAERLEAVKDKLKNHGNKKQDFAAHARADHRRHSAAGIPFRVRCLTASPP